MSIKQILAFLVTLSSLMMLVIIVKHQKDIRVPQVDPPVIEVPDVVVPTLPETKTLEDALVSITEEELKKIFIILLQKNLKVVCLARKGMLLLPNSLRKNSKAWASKRCIINFRLKD